MTIFWTTVIITHGVHTMQVFPSHSTTTTGAIFSAAAAVAASGSDAHDATQMQRHRRTSRYENSQHACLPCVRKRTTMRRQRLTAVAEVSISLLQNTCTYFKYEIRILVCLLQNKWKTLCVARTNKNEVRRINKQTTQLLSSLLWFYQQTRNATFIVLVN